MVVWGVRPLCIGCRKNTSIDPHHVCKRGNAKDKEDRKIHSSIMGCAPLCRECHRGDLHSFDKIKQYLNYIKLRVEMSGYELRKLDYDFMKKYDRYYE